MAVEAGSIPSDDDRLASGLALEQFAAGPALAACFGAVRASVDDAGFIGAALGAFSSGDE